MSRFVYLAILVVLSFSCSSQQKAEEREMNTEIKAQANADTPQELVQRAAESFSNAPGLNPEQKLKLQKIYTSVYNDSMRVRREMGQSKSLLFATLSKVDYQQKEITNLKKKIVALDQERLNIMFKALEDVQKIVGKGVETEKVYKKILDYEVPSHQMRDYNF